MTQLFAPISAVVPGGDTGTSMASKLADWRDAILSLNSGVSRPAYATAGTMWRDTTTTPWVIKMFDGAADVPWFDIDPATHLIVKSYIPGASNAKVLAGLVDELISCAGLQSRIASIAQYRGRTAGYILTGDVVAAALAEVTIPYAATLVLSMNSFINGVCTLAGNPTIPIPSDGVQGWSGKIRFIQGAPGSRVPVFATGWQFPGKVAPTFSTAAGAIDIFSFEMLPDGDYWGALQNNVGRP